MPTRHRLLFTTLTSLLALTACKDDKQPPTDTQTLIKQTLDHMVFVKGGRFMMGNIGYEVPEDNPDGAWVTMADGTQSYRVPFPGCSNSCYPIHKVTLSGYYISQYETTIGEYDIYTKANKLPMVYPDRRGKSDNYLPDRPVYLGVDWFGAEAYCNWLGEVTGLPLKLPTEAQWEYAARSRGKAVRFATDNGELEPGRNYQEHGLSYRSVDPVGKYPPNPLGIYDMSGNANEWVRDWYHPEIYEWGEQTNPTGPAEGDIWNTRKVSRGFGRQHSNWEGRVLFTRIADSIDFTSGNGFRCSIDSDQPLKKLLAAAQKANKTD